MWQKHIYPICPSASNGQLVLPTGSNEAAGKRSLRRGSAWRIHRHHIVDANRNAKGGIGLFHVAGVCPIVRFVCTVDDGVEGVVDLTALDDILCLLVDFVAYGLLYRSGCGDKEIQRLHTGIARALGHNIKQLSIRLGMQLIEYNTVGVETVLVANISRNT